jgi:addiction module RelB/DinJ family antitoxin
MAKAATVRASMHLQKKENVSQILKRLGMNHSEAINVFYSLIEEYQGLPFEVRLPDGDTALKFKPRPEVMKHVDESIHKNRHLGELLAK